MFLTFQTLSTIASMCKYPEYIFHEGKRIKSEANK